LILSGLVIVYGPTASQMRTFSAVKSGGYRGAGRDSRLRGFTSNPHRFFNDRTTREIMHFPRLSNPMTGGSEHCRFAVRIADCPAKSTRDLAAAGQCQLADDASSK
jgi:hypothetical protein